MKKNDLKNKSLKELQEIVSEGRAKLLKLRFALADNRLKDTSEIKKLKVSIAQALTAIRATKDQ